MVWNSYSGLEIAKGNVPKHNDIRKFSVIPDIDTADGWRDVWNLPTKDIYTYPANETAPIDSISSDSGSDTLTMIVEGLDINGKKTIQNAILDGQNRVALSTPLWRVYRSLVLNGDTLIGNVYIYENTAIVGGVPVDTSQIRAYVAATFATNVPAQTTLMSQYTVPAGYHGYFAGLFVAAASKISASMGIVIQARTYGFEFITVATQTIQTAGTSIIQFTLPVPEYLDPNTDIKFMCDTDTNNAGLSVQYWVILEKYDDSETSRGLRASNKTA